MSSENRDFEGGGAILPPSPEDYLRMWEDQSKQLKPNEYQRLADKNKIEARKAVFQEQVRKAVEPNPRFSEIFNANIDI